MKKLFLDDVRRPYSNKWDVVRSYKEFVDYITANGVPDEISFDHDLHPDHYQDYLTGKHTENPVEKTGYDCAKWLQNYIREYNKPYPQKITVHSWNWYGAQNIAHVFKNLVKELIINPYED